MSKSDEIEFVIPGHRDEANEGTERIVVHARRASDGVERLSAVMGRDVVRLRLVDGPELVLNPASASALFAAQSSGGAEAPPSNTQRGQRQADGLGPGEVKVPARLVWRDIPRGPLGRGDGFETAGQVVLDALEVVRGSEPAKLVTLELAAKVDARVRSGLYELTPKALELGEPVSVAQAGEILVLLHGTFSTTAGSFGALWSRHPDRVATLFERFGGRVYGFEHATLGAGPIENAIHLIAALPEGARVHFLTHSRGGLVAEAVTKATSAEPTPVELALFEGEAYAGQADQLKRLRDLAQERKVKIERVVRVACPARGTLLASGRLDAYLSVLTWTLRLAGVPVAAEITEFLEQVARQRTDPRELPGLEAMMPESAFVRWVHQSDVPIDSELRVVAGDIQGDSITTWLKTLLSDAFYWTDNDLVVQTRSMYGGSPRKAAYYFLDRAGKVSHFNYFARSVTAKAIVAAITSESAPEGFEPIGPLSYRGLDSSGKRGVAIGTGSAAARPAVFVIPGILGSHLKIGEQRVWLTARIINGLERLEYGPTPDGVEADAPFESFYADLIEHLATSSEVIPFPFDWREPIEVEAQRLAGKVQEALDARAANRQPVRIIAHSMGGLVARAMEFVAPTVWNAYMGREGARLLMLGTPNAGTWAPMQVMSGDNLIGSLLTYVGALFDEARARKLFAGLPGFIQLQAGLLDSSLNLSREQGWKELAARDRTILETTFFWHSLTIQKKLADWGIPPQALLDQAVALHTRLAAQDLSQYGDRVLTVIGRARRTPDGFKVDGLGVEYLQASDGDGTVPLKSALLPGVKAWQVDVEHAHLPRPRELHPLYEALLRDGKIPDPEFTRSTARGSAAGSTPDVEKMDRMSRSRGFKLEAIDRAEGSLSLPSDAPGRMQATGPLLKLGITNGNLVFVREPLLLGHYQSLALAGAERVMDDLIGGTMSQALVLGRYPTDVGKSDVFTNARPSPHNPFATPRPKAVIVVGLGEEGSLRATDLSASVQGAVIAYAKRLVEAPEKQKTFQLAATLLGSGGIGISVATSALAVAQGVHAVNVRLLKEGWPTVDRLEFVELYEDRATEALRELVAAAARAPSAFEVDPVLKLGSGALPRPAAPSYRGADYDMVSAVKGPALNDQATIAFTIDTRRARTEQRGSSTQLPMLKSLISSAENSRGESKFGKTLFRLLVPRELDSFFGTSDAVVLEVDDETAGIPWEILDVDSDGTQPNEEPWAIRCKLLRKRKLTQFRERPVAAGRQAAVLVIGDPESNRANYPELGGAREEAKAVAKALGASLPLVNAKAPELVTALLSDPPHSIVHIAGHGEESGRGVVLSDDQVLDAEMVERMRRVPDLVFVNCCYAARQTIGPVAFDPAHPTRPARAANIASGLIQIGVRCVIATGWAVDDDAALEFAQLFYERLLAGQRFIDAVSHARKHIWQKFPRSNTWAAYQCYGDPDWVLLSGDPTEGSAGAPREKLAAPELPIASPSTLSVVLKSLAVVDPSSSPKPQLEKLAALDLRHASSFSGQGAAAEAFARAYSDLGDLTHAIDWYSRAVAAEDGEASQRAIEQLHNLRARRAAEQVDEAYRARTDDGQAFDLAVAEAERTIRSASEALWHLDAIHRTYERANLLGSVWKRRAMILQLVELVRPSEGVAAEKQAAISQTIEHYAAARDLARDAGKRARLSYALLNHMGAEFVQDPDQHVYDAAHADVKEVADNLVQELKEPDFWTLVQHEELKLLCSASQKNLVSAVESILREFENIHRRLPIARNWASVQGQTSFLLRGYYPKATEAERGAVDELLARLDQYAEPS